MFDCLFMYLQLIGYATHPDDRETFGTFNVVLNGTLKFAGRTNGVSDVCGTPAFTFRHFDYRLIMVGEKNARYIFGLFLS